MIIYLETFNPEVFYKKHKRRVNRTFNIKNCDHRISINTSVLSREEKVHFPNSSQASVLFSAFFKKNDKLIKQLSRATIKTIFKMLSCVSL